MLSSHPPAGQAAHTGATGHSPRIKALPLAKPVCQPLHQHHQSNAGRKRPPRVYPKTYNDATHQHDLIHGTGDERSPAGPSFQSETLAAGATAYRLSVDQVLAPCPSRQRAGATFWATQHDRALCLFFVVLGNSALRKLGRPVCCPFAFCLLLQVLTPDLATYLRPGAQC